MSEPKATKEASELKKDEIKSAEAGGLDMIAKLTQEAERIISEASEAASREARQELERILDEYERKTKQIVLKIREETKAKTADIAGRLSDTIMLRIEQVSSSAVNSVASEFNIRAGELNRKVEAETAGEIEPQAEEASSVQESGTTEASDANQEEAPAAEAETKVLTEAKAGDNGHKNEPAGEEEGIELKQPMAVDDFDQWLTQ